MSRFNFTGKLRIQGNDSRMPSFRSGKTKKDDPYKSMVLFINPAENNSGVAELFGMKTDEILTKNTENKDMTCSWDDRKDKEVVDKVAPYRKNVIAIGEERKEFVASYDAISYIEDHADELKGKVITLTGRSRVNVYNGNISDRFTIQNIYEVPEDKIEKKKQGLFINDELYFNKDSFDFSGLKDNGKIDVNAYSREWVDSDHPNAMVPKRYIIDCRKVDWDDEMAVKKFNAIFRPMGLAYKDGKVKCSLKSSKYYKMAVNMRMINGAEAAEEFTMDMLTDAQRELVSLGIKSVDDFKPRGLAYGNRILEFKIVSCDLSVDAYKDGEVTEAEESVDEFEELIYHVAESNDEGAELDMNEPEEEEKPKKEKKAEKKVEEDDDDDSDLSSLFD